VTGLSVPTAKAAAAGAPAELVNYGVKRVKNFRFFCLQINRFILHYRYDQNENNTSFRGFTLIELLVVIGIIAILGGEPLRPWRRPRKSQPRQLPEQYQATDFGSQHLCHGLNDYWPPVYLSITHTTRFGGDIMRV